MEANKIIQYQAKENSEELNDFLRDLKNWEEDMKSKERELGYQNLSNQNLLPPIRNKISKSRKKKIYSRNSDGTISKTKRISSFDYSSWDKFDVETALKEIDEDVKSNLTNSDEDTEDENLEIEKKKQKALIEKNKGNEYFKQGRYDKAISCYTNGIKSDPRNSLLPANRAMAFLKKGQLAAAESDCELAISIDPTYVKAYLRRGTARFGLKKFQLAKEDFQKVIELDSDNKLAKIELIKIEQEIINLPNSKKCEMEKDIQIKKYDFERNEIQEENAKRKINSINKIIDNIECSNIVKPINKPPHLRSKKSLKRIQIKEVISDNEHFCEDESLHLSKKHSSKSNVKSQYIIPSVPQTAYQFYADWKALRNKSIQQYHYLEQLSPYQISVLFKQSLDTEVFLDIISILAEYFIKNGHDIFPYLKYLTEVGRFGTLILFLSENEQKIIRKMIDVIKSLQQYSMEEINSLIKSYGII